MTDHPSTPPGQADDQSRPVDIPGLRALAELHMLDVLRIPANLLPPSLEGNPLELLSVALRKAVLRRMRMADRLHVAAAALTAQTIELMEVAGQKRTPQPGHPLNLTDVARIEELTARLRELDIRLEDEAATLVSAARIYQRLHGSAAVLPDDALPGVEDRARQRGVGPQE